MKRQIAQQVTSFVALVCCLSGCQTQHHRWQTTVNIDGSVTRRISQPLKTIPAPASTSDLWQRIGYHNDVDRAIWDERLTDERLRQSAPEPIQDANQYMIASGEFDSLDDVPRHYRYELDGTELASELQHELTINDYWLVKEYVWRESVTDIVKPEEIPAARRESIELFAGLVDETLRNGLDEGTDPTKLIEWIRTDGEQMLEIWSDLIWSPEFLQLDAQAQNKRLQAAWEPFGFKGSSDEQVREFLRQRFREGVKDANGRPIDLEIIDELFDSELTSPREERVKQAWQHALRNQLGESDDAERIVLTLAAKQLGVHRVPFVGPPQEFAVWVKLPGIVVETNGTLDQEDFLTWSFKQQDFGLSGYHMTARSVVPVQVRDSNVLRKPQLVLRTEMLRYLRLVKTDQELWAAIEASRKVNSLAPLEEIERCRANAGQFPSGQSPTTQEQVKWHRARQLLDLLNQAAPTTTTK